MEDLGHRSQYGYSRGHIEPPKAARGHATSYSVRIDGIVLSVTKNNVSGKASEIACTVRLRTFDGTYSWARKMSATNVGTESTSK